MKQSLRIKNENLFIYLMFLFSLVLFILSFFHQSSAEIAIRVSTEMGWMVQRTVSFLLLCLSTQLKKRKRRAYDITLALLLISTVHGFKQIGFSVLIPLTNLILLGGFLCFRRDFCCPGAPTDRKRGFLVLLLSLVGVLVNASISYHYLRPLLGKGRHTYLDSLKDSLLILMGNASTITLPHAVHILELSMFWFSWICILAAVMYAFRPWLAPTSRHTSDLQHARTLLNLYSQNSCSYLALEDDKQLYFGHVVDGVIPYGVVGDTIIINGDPVCADADFPLLLKEFKDFCERSAHKMFFLSVTPRYLEEYKKQGFGCVKCGEEARFALADYEISGKKGAKIMSLQEPEKKMSKSDENVNATIRLLDDTDTIIRKFKRAVTDSGSEVRYSEEKPGVSNLMSIYGCVTGKTMEEIEREFDGKGYGDFKLAVGEAVADELRPLQERYKQLIADKAYIKTLSLERTNSGLSALSGTLYIYFDSLHTVVCCDLCGCFRSHLRCKRCGLSGASETEFACGSPRNCIAVSIRDSNDSIVISCADMRYAFFYVLAFAALSDYLFGCCFSH